MSEPELVFAFDHVVLTVADIEATCAWYQRVLGFRQVVFEGGNVALHFGSQKINLHSAAAPQAPGALFVAAGSADLCFLTSLSLEEVEQVLKREGVMIEFGPVEQVGARGPMDSIYLRDPDGNLIEIARYR